MVEALFELLSLTARDGPDRDAGDLCYYERRRAEELAAAEAAASREAAVAHRNMAFHYAARAHELRFRLQVVADEGDPIG